MLRYVLVSKVYRCYGLSESELIPKFSVHASFLQVLGIAQYIAGAALTGGSSRRRKKRQNPAPSELFTEVWKFVCIA